MYPPTIPVGAGPPAPRTIPVQYETPSCDPPKKWTPAKTFVSSMFDNIGMYSQSKTMMKPCREIDDVMMTPEMGSYNFNIGGRPPSMFQKGVFNPNKSFGNIY